MSGNAETMQMTANPKNIELTRQHLDGQLAKAAGTGDYVYPQVENIEPHLVGPLSWDHPNAAKPIVVDAHAGLIEVTPKRKKVCIVGYAENSRHLAWYNDPECEIWGVNQLYRFIPKADRWFQIHYDWEDRAKWAPHTDQRKWITDSPIPVYMIDHDPSMPNSVRYPIERVMATLKMHDYFTSSIAFMIALAIAEGFEQIGIYGIDLIIGREYHYEKSNVEFLLGIANERGIQIHKPEGCALLWQSFRYGYDEPTQWGFFGYDKLCARAAQLKEQVTLLRDELKIWEGRRSEALWIIDKLDAGARESMEKHITELNDKVDKALNKLFMHDGAAQEVERMRDILEIRMRGGQVA